MSEPMVILAKQAKVGDVVLVNNKVELLVSSVTVSPDKVSLVLGGYTTTYLPKTALTLTARRAKQNHH